MKITSRGGNKSGLGGSKEQQEEGRERELWLVCEMNTIINIKKKNINVGYYPRKHIATAPFG